ncbi:putative target SNARE coiled-coil domain, syntaxin domain, syntaxin/epimorphin [Dioscorea sansibarensis]
MIVCTRITRNDPFDPQCLQDSFVMGMDEQSPRERSIELGTHIPINKSDYGMEDFFKKVNEVEKLMEKVSKQLQKLQDANEESKSVTKASAMKVIKQRMEKDVDEVGKIARNIKTKLEEIDRDNLANRQKPGCEKGTGVDRSRTAMTASLKKKLKERMNDFQMIDDLIETGNSEQILQKTIQEMGKGQVMDTLKEIQERHDTVKEIEKKLLDLHQVFMDMAVLVEAQGEMLDNIETQVANAVNHVQSGNEALRTAKSLQKKSRKCMLIAAFILLIIAIIIALSILKPWK